MVGATFIVYVCLMMLIGYVAWRRTKNLSDYILGGRRLGSWVTALSACASDIVNKGAGYIIRLMYPAPFSVGVGGIAAPGTGEDNRSVAGIERLLRSPWDSEGRFAHGKA